MVSASVDYWNHLLQLCSMTPSPHQRSSWVVRLHNHPIQTQCRYQMNLMLDLSRPAHKIMSTAHYLPIGCVFWADRVDSAKRIWTQLGLDRVKVGGAVQSKERSEFGSVWQSGLYQLKQIDPYIIHSTYVHVTYCWLARDSTLVPLLHLLS